MPSSRKKQILQAKRKRQRRGSIYLVIAIITIVVAGVGLYVYASSLSSNSTPSVIYAKLNTSQGVMEVELYRSLTPRTVDNFVNLANSGFYNSLVWHRIVKNFVIQTGNSNSRNGLNNATWSQPGSGAQIPFEYDSSLHNAVGYLGMASTASGAGGTTQFYVNTNDNSAALDGKYAVFGKVIIGMSVAYAIANLPIYTDGQPVNPSDAMLNSITISNSP